MSSGAEREPRAESEREAGLEVWAVVVNWNGGAANLVCLASLVAAGLLEERIVFVDNGSVDGSLAEVRARHPRLALLENESNLGFGEGANQGTAHALAAGAQGVLWINNDLRLDPAALRELSLALKSEAALGVVGPLVLFDDGTQRVWCAGGVLDHRQNLSTLLGHGQARSAAHGGDRDVDYVAGCALLVRREVLERVGLLRADYFAYMEDVEFCLRVRRAGCRVRTIGRALAWHAPSSATGGGYSARRKYMQGVNSVRFLREYGGAREWLRFLWFDVASLAPLLLVAPFRGRSRAVLAKASGILAGLRGRRVEARILEPGGSWLW